MLLPHTYLTKVKNYFKAQQHTWDFFAAQKAKEKEWADFKNSLLKNAYRMSPETEADIYQRLEDVKRKLDIAMPVTLYQLQGNNELNAFISYQQNEAHLVFCGPVLKLLQGNELTALLAHELSHVKLYMLEDGDYYTANNIVMAIANDSRSEDVFLETARYFRLYTEIFCDRGALLATGSEEITQASLIKMYTGLEQVSAVNYLKQATEVLENNTGITSENDTHPENFMRVLAVHLYQTTPVTADENIAKLIERKIDMDKLDIFRQEELKGYTKYILEQFTQPKWMQTNSVMAICSQYFTDFAKHEQQAVQWQNELLNPNTLEYLSYVLLDIVKADPELEDVPLGRALQLSDQFGFKEEFNSVLKKEYKLSDKRLRELQAKAVEAVSKNN